MTINKITNTYFTLTLASILAVFSLFFLVNAPMAHADEYSIGGYYGNGGYGVHGGYSDGGFGVSVGYSEGGYSGGRYSDGGGYNSGYNQLSHNDNYGSGYGGRDYHYIAPENNYGHDNDNHDYHQPDHNKYHYTAPTTVYVPTYTYVQPTPSYVYEQPTYQYQQPIVYEQPTTYQQYPTYSYNTVASSYPSTYVQTTPTTYYNQTNSNAGGLSVTCSSDPSTAFVNQPVTWTAQVTNGLAPYTYSWTGSDGLTGTQSTVLKYYSSLGQKSAVVTVTSSDGLTGTIACGNSLTVKSSYSGVNRPTQTTTVVPTNTNAQVNPNSANAFGSIGGISFGIFAILIILILIATIIYIVLSRSKI